MNMTGYSYCFLNNFTHISEAEVVCRVGQTERKCTEEDLNSSEYKDLLCQGEKL